MLSLNQRIELLTRIGGLLRDISSPDPTSFVKEAEQLTQALPLIRESNPWFTPDSVLHAVRTWGQSLQPENIRSWISPYELAERKHEAREVLVILAGNIPLVGMHDFLCVLLTGHKFVGKLSSKDNLLFPLIKNWILNFDDDWGDYINFTTQPKNDAEILIATGSNNTSRIIRDTYAGAKSIIRHNRNSIALLNGNESDAELEKLTEDILLYYGLGCRNVSRIFIPKNYDLTKLAGIIRNCQISLPESMLNNLKYQKALASLHKQEYIDAGKVLLLRGEGLNSPIGTVYFSEYNDVSEINLFRSTNKKNIQCVLGDPRVWKSVTAFGDAQSPALNDYADGIDTIDFLIKL